MHMKYLILKWIYAALYYLCIFKLFYFLQRNQQTIITYHNIISDDIFNSDLMHLGVSCSEKAFINQINVIFSRFNITSEIGIPESCVISFDDGYRNNIEIASYILNEKNIHGLFFVPACYFDNNHDNSTILWIDQILMWVSYAPSGKYLILGDEVSVTPDSASRHLLWTYLYQKILSKYSILASLIRELDNNYSFSELKKTINTKMYQLRFETMTVKELDEMKKMGHKLGCHSFKHDILSLLTEKQLEHDFLMCSFHSDKYNTNLYSYPFGGKNEVSANVISKCKKYNYSAAFLNYETNSQDIYALGRISLGNKTDKWFIEAQLCGFEKFLKELINIYNQPAKVIVNLLRKIFYGNIAAFRN